MHAFSRRTTALFLAAAFLLAAHGCSSPARRQRLPESVQGSASAPMYRPLSQTGTFLLDDREAALLARKLRPNTQNLRSWNDMAYAVDQSISYAATRPQDALAVQRPGLTLTWAQMTASLRRLREILPMLDSNPEFLTANFRVYRLGPDFMFTGYYEPTLEASRTPTAARPYPLYKLPPDLKKGVPYHSREAIDRKGALRGKGLEIAWVDETDAYFLQVQGSGRLLFPDGTSFHVLYAGKNNQSYVSLGRIMKEDGLLPENGVNMRAIREYLAANPAQRSGLFDRNPSYVFFRPADHGPVGGMGRPVTPWVSLAVDRNVVPYGAAAIVSVPIPDADGRGSVPFHGLTLAQDTGGAIKNNRIDLFCGPGDVAQHVAGHLDAAGAVYLLVAK